MKNLIISALAFLAAASPAMAKDKVIVAMARSDTFLDLLKASVTEAGAAKSNLEFEFKDANNDPDAQIRQVKEALAKKPAVLMLLGVNDAADKAAADMAAEAKVPLVFLNRLPAFDNFKGATAIVASNDLVAGRLQMRVLSEKIGGKGNVVILRGEDGHPAAIGRTKGVKEVLADMPNVKIVKDVTGNWRREDAEKLVLGWLDSGMKIDAIAANNDEMAIGAINALKKRGIPPGTIAVGGVDGTAAAMKEMRGGYLAVSVLQNAKAQGRRAVEDADKFAKNEGAPLYDWVPYELIIPANMAKYE